MSTAEEVIKSVLESLRPSLMESERVARLSENLVSTIKEMSGDYGGILEVRVEGSAAKGTWVRGREEIDIFIQFSKEVPKEDLERKTIEIGTNVIKRFGGKPMLRYAEHPYVEGTIEGIRVNIVACYRVKPGSWLSAVDRTPYHTEYVKSKLTSSLVDEIRLTKSFMIGCGLYGAEIRVGGFSGYLAELLTIHYGSFLNMVTAASSWRPPVSIDMESHYPSRRTALERFGRPPILVIDPVDKMRNVAAAITDTKLSEFILASKLFIEKPSESFFYIPRRVQRTKTMTEVRRVLKGRNLLLLNFRVQEKSPDVLWGELKHTMNGIKRAMEHEGFKVIRFDAFLEDGRCFMLFELLSLALTSLYPHTGPPVYLQSSMDFIKKHKDSQDTVAGPWVDGNRLYVLKKRLKTSAKDILKMRLARGDVSISDGMAENVKKATIRTKSEELARIASKYLGFKNFLYDFLEARPPFLRA